MKNLYPAYLVTDAEGKLEEKTDKLNKILLDCTLCPRKCKVNRIKGKKGYCGAGQDVRVSSAFAHFGEEPPLVGKNGSGTVFFSYCNLKCLFCQNYEISHLAEGKDVNSKQLAGYMLRLQESGCHNINLVTPTHFVPQIVAALRLAKEQGLRLPLVYNCGGYESAEVIDLLDGLIDIYMPDAKFSSPQVAERLCQAVDYFDNLKIILKKMYAQVGDLAIVNKIASRGLLIRHLVMPNGLAGTEAIMQFIAQEISPHTYINIMNQYRPCGRASGIAEINRPITAQEYLHAVEIASSFGLRQT